MPYRLDRCLIDGVSKLKQMKNKKGLRLRALEIRSSAHQTGSCWPIQRSRRCCFESWNRFEVLLMIAREVFCNSDRGYLCCVKQVLTSVLFQLASKRLRAGNRYSNRESVKILRASFEDLESSWDSGAWKSWSAVEIQIGDTYVSPIAPSREKRVKMTTVAQILSSPTKCFGRTSENSVDRVDRSLAK